MIKAQRSYGTDLAIGSMKLMRITRSGKGAAYGSKSIKLFKIISEDSSQLNLRVLGKLGIPTRNPSESQAISNQYKVSENKHLL